MEPCVVLSTRRLEAVYDVGTLVEAARRGASPALHVRIAGSGSLEPILRAQAEPLGVTFLGWLSQTQLTRELLHAQIYVSTSVSDSTSVSLLEAMAAGCFPVVSDIAGNREWIEHGIGGFLFPPGNAEALAARLHEAAADAELRARAAVHNRRLVEARATWELTMRTAERVFTLVADAPRQDHHL
jgi:glycosyltransferase involved in cell wall biosynthesis